MIFRSRVPDVEIPEQSLPAFLLERMERMGDKPALIDGPSGRTLTYRRLVAAVRACAAGLAARGFAKGDVLAIYSPNLPEYAVAFQAVALLGGINTTINPAFTADELAKQLTDSGARFLLTVGAVLDKALQAARKAGIETVFSFDGAPGSTPFAELLARGGEPPAVEINPAQDVVALPYSSGTTGLPKGVMLTHRNLVANQCQIEAATWNGGVQREDVAAAVIPFFHIYGLSVILCNGLLRGATIVCLPRFEIESYLAALETYRVTFLYVVPPIVLQLAKHPSVERYDVSRVRMLYSGAAPLGEALEHEATTRLRCRLMQGYGMTEASPVTHLSSDRPGGYRPGTVGLLAPGTELRIVDVASGRALGSGEPGELWMRGPQFMKGYLNQPEATAASLDAEGWYHSGDIGRVEEDGCTFIVDRLKELIKVKGFQVAPAELEALLVTHPAVSDAAVVRSPDAEAGEVPKAFVVLKDGAAAGPAGGARGASAGAEQIMAWVAERVAPYKRIRRLEFVEHIPKSPSGKILRRLLMEQERERAAG
jgi:acyl-CoA synthetase (AMP-forming)/AMP-acid ligase II